MNILKKDARILACILGLGLGFNLVGEGIIKDGAQLRLMSDTFKFTEGPAPDAEGNVYFTDQPNDRIMVWTVDGHLETFLQPSGRSNGLFFDSEGHLIACADEKNELWVISIKSKEKRVLVGDYNGKLLNGPNDAWIDPAGGIYFSDPFYKRPYWNRGDKEQDTEAVYYLKPDGKTLVRAAADFKRPNGLIGTPDGRTLYVADIGDKKTYRFKIAEDGSLQDREKFCDLGSDGMTLDKEGNVYLTGRGVTVFNSKGEQIDHIEVNENWTANVCFGGADRSTLFITAMDSLYAIETRVKGAY